MLAMVLSRFVWSITLYLTLHAVKPQDGTLGHHPQPQLSRNIIISFNVNLKSINTWTDFYRYSALISDDTGVWLFGWPAAVSLMTVVRTLAVQISQHPPSLILCHYLVLNCAHYLSVLQSGTMSVNMF